MGAGATPEYDDLVMGSGMAGLALGALLARHGSRVLMLEAHDAPGGYAHSFSKGPYRFCAQVHYASGCGPGGAVHRLLAKLGLGEEVTWNRLDPDGFDVVVIGGERFPIPNGLENCRERWTRRFPEAEVPLRRWFELLAAVRRELDALPDHPGLLDLVTAPFRFFDLLRYRSRTLSEVFDQLGMPARVRAVLAGQCGDYFLPPSRAAFLGHAALVTAYDQGAFYPERHWESLIEALAGVVTRAPGSKLLLGREVTRIEHDGRQVTAVHTAGGETFRAGRYHSNIDPARTAGLLGLAGDSRFPDGYEYSPSAFTLYLGIEGLDLRDHGFGRANLWHYPDEDLDRAYRRQLEEGDFSDPWIFLASPSLMSDAPGLAPPGHQVLHAITVADYRRFAELHARDPRAYLREKNRIRDRILDVIEDRYVPGIRDHLRLKLTGSPTTNERFCWAPQGNAYGVALTPASLSLSRGPGRSPLGNLWLANATAGYPGIAGTAAAGSRLFTELTGEPV